MQRISKYCFCKTCGIKHNVTDGNCFPRYFVITDDTPEEGVEIAATSPEEAAEFFVNGYDDDYELMGKSVQVDVVNPDGVKNKYEVTGETLIIYEAKLLLSS